MTQYKIYVENKSVTLRQILIKKIEQYIIIKTHKPFFLIWVQLMVLCLMYIIPSIIIKSIKKIDHDIQQ